MTFRSSAQPLCRCCGKRIAKRTHTVYCKHPDGTGGMSALTLPTSTTVFGTFSSKADCQRVTNQQVASVSYGQRTPTGIDRSLIGSFTTWDGESYDDEFFCSGSCAKAFGYLAARNHPELRTQAYADAHQRNKETAT